MIHGHILSIFVYHVLLVASLVFLQQTQAGDLPCLPRQSDPDLGFVCVCNSSYCDTIERPTPLARGLYYRYSTSNSTPGFTQTTGTFSEFTRDSEYVFTVNSSVAFQEILGFGGASTDSAAFMLNTLPQEAQDKLMESYFGSYGIEYNLLRVPIGASDFSLRYYTLDDTPGDEDLHHFSLQNEDIILKIPLIKKAMTLSERDLKVIACSWHSPQWMKSNNATTCGYLLDKYQSSWARYHVKFLQAYKSAGIDVWAISEGNEPIVPFVLDPLCEMLDSTLISAASERVWIKDHLYPQLAAANFSQVLYLTFEDLRFFALHWMSRLAEDPEAMEKVAGIALHWYMEGSSDPSVLDDLHSQFPDKLIMYTEGSLSKKTPRTSWLRAEYYAHYILQYLNHWGQSFIDWNLMLDTEGGPSMSFRVDAPIIVNQTSGEFYKQPMFYVLGHFSKFIPPGSRRVQMISNKSHLDKERKQSYEKFSNPRSNYNELNKRSGRIFDVPATVEGVAVVRSDGCLTIILSNKKNVAATVTIEDVNIGNIHLVIEAHSINTLLYC